MPIRISQTQRPQAEDVLEVLKQKLKQSTDDGIASISIYENGREHGYHVAYWPKGSKITRAVSFSQYRNTDNIVVYPGKDIDFAYNTYVPNEEVYRTAKFFEYQDFRGAAQFIFDYLLDIK